MDKVCTRCNQSKDLSCFYKKKLRSGNQGLTSECISCLLKRTAEYKHNNKDKTNAINRLGYDRARIRFFELYGNKCSCCGESEIKFLTIDHINGQAGRKRETTQLAYSRAAKKYDPSTYRILCHNCNHAVRFGICPHQKH